MEQENGRFKPADKSEYANNKIKTIKCEECGAINEIKKIFGEVQMCEKCGCALII